MANCTRKAPLYFSEMQLVSECKTLGGNTLSAVCIMFQRWLFKSNKKLKANIILPMFPYLFLKLLYCRSYSTWVESERCVFCTVASGSVSVPQRVGGIRPEAE